MQTNGARGGQVVQRPEVFCVVKMKRPAAAMHGDQSIKDGPETAGREDEDEEDALISVAPDLTLMATSQLKGYVSTELDYFFLLAAQEKKKINSWSPA